MAAHPEELLISALLKTGKMDAVRSAGVTHELFTVYQDEMKWIEKFWSKHGGIPGKVTFRSHFPDFTIFKTFDVEQHCRDVKEEYARAKMTALIDKTVDTMIGGQIDKAIDNLGTDVLRIQAAIADDPGDHDMAADYMSTYDDVMKRVKRVEELGRAGVPTGFPTLDEVTGGLQPGWLCIVAARLGTGKTYAMIRMATAAVFAGYAIQYYSLEQSRHQIDMRAHSFMASKYGYDVFQSAALMRGTGFNLIEYKKFLKEMSDDLSGRWVTNDATRGRVSPLTVAGGIERNHPDEVFIDYLTLMEAKGTGDWRSVAALSGDLKQIAERYEVPVVAASQINRAGAGADPTADHLSQSDAIGMDADLILTMVRKSKRVMKMKLAKFRHGEDGIHWFAKFSPGTGQFEEIAGDEADELIQEDSMVD